MVSTLVFNLGSEARKHQEGMGKSVGKERKQKEVWVKGGPWVPGPSQEGNSGHADPLSSCPVYNGSMIFKKNKVLLSTCTFNVNSKA